MNNVNNSAIYIALLQSFRSFPLVTIFFGGDGVQFQQLAT